MTGDPYAMEIVGIDIIQVVEVVIALAATYLIARIVTKTLEKIFEKTPFNNTIPQPHILSLKRIIGNSDLRLEFSPAIGRLD